MLKKLSIALLVFTLLSHSAAALVVNGPLKGAQLENLAADPTGVTGRVYHNTVGTEPKYYNGTDWKRFLDGNASTATALAANPNDCAAGQYGSSIDASGNLTCAQVSLDQIAGPAADWTINTGNHTLHWQFSAPDGAFHLEALGAATGHFFEVMQQTGNPASDLHLMHIEAADADPTMLHLVPGAATSRALKLNTTGENAGPGRMTVDASGKHAWGDGTNATDVTLERSGASTLTVGGTLAATAFSGPLTGAVTGDVTGNVSGTSANVTGTVAIANGGTGQTGQTAAFDALAPTTTKGDLIVHNGTDNVRLAAGTNGYVLTTDSGEAAGVKWAASASNPTTTKGDLSTYSTAADRLPVGSDGQIVFADSSASTGLSWQWPNKSVAKTTTYTATGSDSTILASTSGGAWTLTLPAAASYSGKVYHIVQTASTTNALTIDPNASETVCGLATIKVIGQNDAVTVQSDGTNWIGLHDSCERNDRILVTNSGTPTIAESDGWVTSLTDSGTGDVIVNTSAYSDVPSCACNVIEAVLASSNKCHIYSITSSAIRVATGYITSGTMVNADYSFSMVCRGPR